MVLDQLNSPNSNPEWPLKHAKFQRGNVLCGVDWHVISALPRLGIVLCLAEELHIALIVKGTSSFFCNTEDAVYTE